MSLNKKIPIIVLTNKGFKDIRNLVPGDIVYEYKTNKEYEVKKLKKQKINNLYNIEYTDGRSAIYSEDELLYTGYETTDIISALNIKEFPEIHLYPFENIVIKEKPLVDPYLAAIFIIYGDYNLNEISIPLDILKDLSLDILYKYHIETYIDSDKNKVFFTYEYSISKITWKEFFGNNLDMYAITKRITSPFIPDQYMFSFVLDRWKFIRGVFDIGYNIKLFRDKVAIYHWSEDRLKWISRMLWSLGITCKIVYDPFGATESKPYVLIITGKYDCYPGFFYNNKYIMNHLFNSDSFYAKHNDVEMKIKSIKQITDLSKLIQIDTNDSCNIILDKPKVLFITDNYLPRVSI